MTIINHGSILGVVTTILATILLGIVAFDVPYFKAVYFLRAAITNNGTPFTIDMGVLGYCGSLDGGPLLCTAPKVGYEVDPNILFNNTTSFNIPAKVIKWLTSALVLHVVAFGISVISAAFALLSLLRVPIASCFTSCFNGFAGFVALVAFIFDLVFFSIVKHRINKAEAGSAVIGNAIWIMLVAWILMFLSPCFFIFGKCCCSSRKSKY